MPGFAGTIQRDERRVRNISLGLHGYCIRLGMGFPREAMARDRGAAAGSPTGEYSPTQARCYGIDEWVNPR
jgi:hypothetical protein